MFAYGMVVCKHEANICCGLVTTISLRLNATNILAIKWNYWPQKIFNVSSVNDCVLKATTFWLLSKYSFSCHFLTVMAWYMCYNLFYYSMSIIRKF